MTLEDLHSLPGTRDYLEENWFSPGDVLLAHSNDENREAFSAEIARNFAEGKCADPNDIPAFSGRKYDDYGGYGKCIQPVSIFEVGVAAGYSIAAMIRGAGESVRKVVLMDFHPDLVMTVDKLRRTFPNVRFDYNLVNSQTDWDVVPPQLFDIVHVDGEHTYQGALNDLNHFGKYLSGRGLIVVDDAKDPNIERACREFAELNRLERRFIDNHNGHILMMHRRVAEEL